VAIAKKVADFSPFLTLFLDLLLTMKSTLTFLLIIIFLILIDNSHGILHYLL